MEQTTGLEIRDLVLSVGDRKIELSHLSVEAHERIALVGPSGAGKTTLLRAIAGLHAVISGQMMLNGESISMLAPEKRQIGFVFQEQALFPAMSVIENITFGLRMKKTPQDQRRQKGLEWVQKIGLSGRADDSVLTLSGGEKQRVALARALVTEPRLLLMDEPFSAIDRERKNQLTHLIIDLLNERPIPLLFVTHHEEDVKGLATRVCHLSTLTLINAPKSQR